MLVNKKFLMILFFDMGQIGFNQGFMYLIGFFIEMIGYEEIGDRVILDREGWIYFEIDGEKKNFCQYLLIFYLLFQSL